jgi:hypothetical protein
MVAGRSSLSLSPSDLNLPATGRQILRFGMQMGIAEERVGLRSS